MHHRKPLSASAEILHQIFNVAVEIEGQQLYMLICQKLIPYLLIRKAIEQRTNRLRRQADQRLKTGFQLAIEGPTRHRQHA